MVHLWALGFYLSQEVNHLQILSLRFANLKVIRYRESAHCPVIKSIVNL